MPYVRDVMFDTEASKLVSKTRNISHDWSTVSVVWFVLPNARELWRLKLHSPENHVTTSVSASYEANLSAVSFTL